MDIVSKKRACDKAEGLKKGSVRPGATGATNLQGVPNAQHDMHFASILGGEQQSLQQEQHEILASLGLFQGWRFRGGQPVHHYGRPAVAQECVERNKRGWDDVA